MLTIMTMTIWAQENSGLTLAQQQLLAAAGETGWEYISICKCWKNCTAKQTLLNLIIMGQVQMFWISLKTHTYKYWNSLLKAPRLPVWVGRTMAVWAGDAAHPKCSTSSLHDHHNHHHHHHHHLVVPGLALRQTHSSEPQTHRRDHPRRQRRPPRCLWPCHRWSDRTDH